MIRITNAMNDTSSPPKIRRSRPLDKPGISEGPHRPSAVVSMRGKGRRSGGGRHQGLRFDHRSSLHPARLLPALLLTLLLCSGLPALVPSGVAPRKGTDTIDGQDALRKNGNRGSGPYTPFTFVEERFEGFDGPSRKPVVPMNRVSVVRYDENGIRDDLAFLAAVPGNVFYSNSADRIYSNPLLYYQPGSNNKVENAYKGLSYFMDDWSGYLGGDVDDMVLMGFSRDEGENFRARWPSDVNGTGVTSLSIESPFGLAAETATREWLTSDRAVVAVIDEELSDVSVGTEGTLNGTMPAAYANETFRMNGTIDVGPVPPVYHNFSVPDPYKYVHAGMSWDNSTGKDPDLQLYDWQLGEADASENWNPVDGAVEEVSSYVYHNGEWGAAVTYMPTENELPRSSPVNPVNYDIDVDLYPGVELELPEAPYGCRDVEIALSWADEGQGLGLALTGPAGENIASSLSGSNPAVLSPVELGRANYTVTVLKLDDHASNTTFNVTYSWNRTGREEEADRLGGAAQGAVLASLLNAPLLYTGNDTLPDETRDALTDLDVSEISVVDIGDTLSPDVKDRLEGVNGGMDISELTSYKDAYDAVRAVSRSTDIVFSTLDPWTKWNVNKEPGEETEAGLHIGPSAFAAAHHGASLVLTEAHASLTTSKAWHNTYWRNNWEERESPSVGDMVITARTVYDALDSLGLDGPGAESVLTVAGQYDIGPGWDRGLLGASVPGRFVGSPVDAAYSICRNIFYPAIIHVNPAANPDGIDLINGSRSHRDGDDVLRIYEPAGEERFRYPVLHSYISYRHRFNQRGSRYWGTNYTTTNGIVPYWSPSSLEIDEDVNERYGRPGRYWPDLTQTEVMPFYTEKSGYDSVYSTYFFPCVENLNRGVFLWSLNGHGSARGSGSIGLWRGDEEEESNPWRGYETNGSTDEPDSMAMRKDTGAETHESTGEDDRDGVVIAIEEQRHTASVSGELLDDALDNLRSAGFITGACLPGDTFLHLSLIRHGSVFQVINPWTSAWFTTFAYEIMARQLALGDTVGEAYKKGMEMVGIMYSTEQWWWDVLQNVVYFGDPDLRMFSPAFGWPRPAHLNSSSKPLVEGHTPFGHYPDPAILSLTLSDDEPDQYERVDLYVTIANDGLAEVRDLELRVVLDGKVKDRISVAPMAPGDTVTVNSTVQCDSWGLRSLETYIDPDDEIREFNENDNYLGKDLPVNALPLASLSARSEGRYTGDNFTFDANASGDPDGNVTAYRFDLGDGNQTPWLNTSEVSYAYGDDGIYDVRVRVKDDKGALSDLSSAYKAMVLNRKPRPAFSVRTEERLWSGGSLMFDGSETFDPDGRVTNWTWELDGGTVKYGPAVSHAYGENGVYRTTLIVKDDDGAIAYAERFLTVENPSPKPLFTVEPGIAGNRISDFVFSAASDFAESAGQLAWDLGDGTVVYNKTQVTHRYAELGNYNVTLVAKGEDAIIRSKPRRISVENIFPLLDIYANRTEAKTFEYFQFHAEGSDSDGGNLTYSWDFGDEGGSGEANVSHSYADDGIYNVSCTVLDDDGARVFSNLSVNVSNRPPEAFFTPSARRIGTGEILTLSSKGSSDKDGTIVNYTWDLGDGTVLYGKEVGHIYEKTSEYAVALTVTDDDNFSSSYELEITSFAPRESSWERFEGAALFGSIILMALLVGVALLYRRKRTAGRKGIDEGEGDGEGEDDGAEEGVEGEGAEEGRMDGAGAEVEEEVVEEKVVEAAEGEGEGDAGVGPGDEEGDGDGAEERG